MLPERVNTHPMKEESVYFKTFRYTVGLTILGILMACVAFAIVKPQTSADWNDPVLEQYEVLLKLASITEGGALQSSKLAHEAAEKADEVYYNASGVRCEQEKVMAYYKLANGYELNREAELKAKTEMNCTAF